MRPLQQYYYAQQSQLGAQLNSGFIPGQQQNSQFLPPLYSSPGPHNGVQVMGMPMGAVGGPQGFSIGPGMPMQNGLPSQQWGQLRPETQSWGQGVSPSQGHGQPYSQQFVQQQHSGAFLQPGGGRLHGGDGIRGGNEAWGHGHEVNGNARLGGDRAMHHDLRRPSDGQMRQSDHYPHGSSQHKSYGSKTSGSWSNGAGRSDSRSGGGRNVKGRGGDRDREPVRPQAVSLRCEPCDRTFTNSQQFAAHKSTHVKCDVQGCMFEASGRVVKEHKQANHDNSPSIPVGTGNFKSKESEEEVLRWREERRKNYPTTTNIQHKEEEMSARKARGELVDEDARKRRERLKEVLARQAELGVPVAEVPAYYMSDRYGSFKGKGESSGTGRRDNPRNGKRRLPTDPAPGPDGITKEEENEPSLKVARTQEPSKLDATGPVPSACEQEVETAKDAQLIVNEVKDHPLTETGEPDPSTNDNNGPASCRTSEKLCYFFKRGRCKKGTRCEFLHERKPKKRKDAATAQTVSKRSPTLLAKLLESDIRREKSHLLQAFRFFVNNMFFLEYPGKPLKFFDWTETEDHNSEGEVVKLDEQAQELEVDEDEDEDSDEDEDAETAPMEEDNGGSHSDSSFQNLVA